MEKSQIATVLEKHGITMETLQTGVLAGEEDGEWGLGATHWTCVLTRRDAFSIQTRYHMGSALKGPPKIDEVVDSLLLDADGADQSFEEWCSDIGFDVDSRRADRIYNACVVTAKRLRQFFGVEILAELRACERL